MEQWCHVDGYRYLVSDQGRVMSSIGQQVNPMNDDGILYVTLYKFGRPVTHSVAKLVAQAFLDNLQGRTRIRHVDGNRLNCKSDNLTYASGFMDDVDADPAEAYAS